MTHAKCKGTSTFFYFLLVFIYRTATLRGELWEEDVTSQMTIGLSTTGYESVDLRCDPNHFSVNVTLGEDFEGVVYTRGSFDEKKLPCFKGHEQASLKDKRKLIIGLRIPYNKCKTIMDVAESRYTNTLVVQHDPDLIMPGDAAFSLDCGFVPEFKLHADLTLSEEDSTVKSKITLVDADPSAKSRGKNLSVSSQTEKVRFVPNSGGIKDEL